MSWREKVGQLQENHRRVKVEGQKSCRKVVGCGKGEVSRGRGWQESRIRLQEESGRRKEGEWQKSCSRAAGVW